MCGRYTLFLDRQDGQTHFLQERLRQRFPDVPLPDGDIFPDCKAPVYVPEHGRARLAMARWGLQNPHRKGLLINARAETAAEKPLFRESLYNRRCAIPCNGFYEWSPQKERYAYTLAEVPLFYLAGLFTKEKDELHFVILTIPANASVAPVHHRMPVLMCQEAVRPWLFDTQRALALLRAPMPLLESARQPPTHPEGNAEQLTFS